MSIAKRLFAYKSMLH